MYFIFDQDIKKVFFFILQKQFFYNAGCWALTTLSQFCLVTIFPTLSLSQNNCVKQTMKYEVVKKIWTSCFSLINWYSNKKFVVLLEHKSFNVFWKLVASFNNLDLSCQGSGVWSPSRQGTAHFLSITKRRPQC